MTIIILSFLLATAAVIGGYIIGETLLYLITKLVQKSSSCTTDSSAADTEKKPNLGF